MQNVDAAHTRSFALIGHAADGKTSLGEAFLHAAGATPGQGSVDAGSSRLDHTPEERDRHHTLTSSFFALDWQDQHITLVNTPGDPNFQGDGQIVLAGVDGAVLLVSAVDGAKVGTEAMWRASQRFEVATIGFVGGMDHDRANLQGALDSLRRLGANPVEIALPIGEGPQLKGVVDLLRMCAVIDGKECEIPAEQAEAAAAGRSRLVEAVAETDDELLEKYLEEGALGEAETRAGLVAATQARKLMPVACGVATAEIGTRSAFQAAVTLLPSAAQRGAWMATAVGSDEPLELAPDASGPSTALVLKTAVDRYAGTLSFLRIVSGTLTADQTVQNATRGEKERLGKLMLPLGAEHKDVPMAGPGDIVAVAKLKGTHTGDALTQERDGCQLPSLPIPKGALSYAIQAHVKGDEDKLFTSLGRLVEEDPTLALGRDPSTGEFLLTGVGELHIRITAQKLKRLYDVAVDLKTPQVPYRETITRSAVNVEGKLKKQTGGKGMFGVCYLTLEPLPRGKGMEFKNEVAGGAIPRNLIPAVEKGVQEAALKGPLAGYPVVDVRVRCIDGKHHSVDSNEMAFKLAGSFGFKAGVEKAGPTLLEPIMKVEIAVPDEHVGDVMGDVSSRRGRVQTTETRGSSQVIKAEVPMAEMLEYASALTSLTGGKGAFQMELSHYDELPAHEREKLIAAAGAQTSKDT